MADEKIEPTLEALQEIRNIMNRSTRFLSLSGWSGIWAGLVALAGSFIAHGWLKEDSNFVSAAGAVSPGYFDLYTNRLIMLALAVFVVAFAGGLYFTYRKASRAGQQLWNHASRQFLLQLFFPMVAGGIFALVFIYHGLKIFVAPICLSFYGLALISGSKHTLSEIRYLGMIDVALGCANLFFPEHGLLFWALGFGVLHIVYGGLMWNKYGK